ncbi:uncharacterized protein LOC103571749 [Microplitis demolitor]|uniref:uncharacterized protein LOC103571749 n=1 Tax=Microplitis demolitor TaxID=69319 RepID=UPI00043FFDD2|nr:uncharacterized protein LOC103571749 [Microplitis demolitor]
MLRVLYVLLLSTIYVSSFSFVNIVSFAKYLYPRNLTYLNTGAGSNELWRGILRDCNKKLTFSCLQKNAYSYLDNTLGDYDNITVFDGFLLTKNNLNYDTCSKNCGDEIEEEENFVDQGRSKKDDDYDDGQGYQEPKTPLEEITSALRDRTVKFLATRDYEIQLPEFIFDKAKIKISPKEIDRDGALVRVDFGSRGLEHGRFFKKIRKFIQNRLLLSFLALILIIKLIKVKFMFIIPFLFGIGTAKKIFLKLLLFFIPAFAHVFKLCSSYYNSHTKYHHHHHHQIAHHHHHVPVPVPVPAPVPAPTYYDPHHHSPHPPYHDEEFEGYDYAHPHIQLRKDMEELKEWGIDSFTDLHDDNLSNKLSPVQHNYSPYLKPANVPVQLGQPVNVPSHGQNLAYSGYLDDQKFNRRVSGGSVGVGPGIVPSVPIPSAQVGLNTPSIKHTPVAPTRNDLKATHTLINNNNNNNNMQQVHPVFVQHSQQPVTNPQQQTQINNKRLTQQHVQTQVTNKKNTGELGQVTNQVDRVAIHDDTFYGPILRRLDDIFLQLKFSEEPCKERLICSMYKNPGIYSPHSNIVSNELSRDPQELKRKVTGSASSQRFYRYVAAARLGQEGGDCLRNYPCHINTE